MSNHLELMLEALKTCTEDEYGQHFHQTQVKEAIAAGEAELRREPDFWVMRCPDDVKEFLNMDEQSVITTSRDETTWEEYEGWSVTAYFAREEIK